MNSDNIEAAIEINICTAELKIARRLRFWNYNYCVVVNE